MTDWAKANDDEIRSNDGISSLSVDDTANDGDDRNRQVQPPIKTMSSVPRLTRAAINSRTRQLVKALTTTHNATSQTIRLQELSRHLTCYPDAVSLAVAEGAVPILFNLRDRYEDSTVKAYSRQALTLCGHVDPPRGRGIRILSIDGGGTRGVVILEVLRCV